MQPLAPGSPAPPIEGVRFDDGPTAVWFYKVTCPVCQMAAPKAELIERAYPGRIVGVGQDPDEALDRFGRDFGLGVPRIADLGPYPISDAYGIETVPTLFLVDRDGTVIETVPAWDRDGYNRVSSRLADLIGTDAKTISEAGDGLPPFRPG